MYHVRAIAEDALPRSDTVLSRLSCAFPGVPSAQTKNLQSQTPTRRILYLTYSPAPIAMLYNFLVAALAFSAPPSLTRRDMMVNGAGFAAAMVSAPAFAKPSDYAGAADRKKAAKKEAEIAAAGGVKDTPYETLMKSARVTEEAGKKSQSMAVNYGGTSNNGKSDGGVSYRKPTDPNACSDVCCLACLKLSSAIWPCRSQLTLCSHSRCLLCRFAGVQEEAP